MQVKVKDMKPKRSAKGGTGNTVGIGRGFSGNTIGVRGFGAISNPS